MLPIVAYAGHHQEARPEHFKYQRLLALSGWAFRRAVESKGEAAGVSSQHAAFVLQLNAYMAVVCADSTAIPNVQGLRPSVAGHVFRIPEARRLQAMPGLERERADAAARLCTYTQQTAMLEVLRRSSGGDNSSVELRSGSRWCCRDRGMYSSLRRRKEDSAISC